MGTGPERARGSASPSTTRPPERTPPPPVRPPPAAPTAGVLGAGASNYCPAQCRRGRRGGTDMRIGVLGTGMVGQALAGKMAELGHQVMVGTRDVDDLLARTEGSWGTPPYSEWLAKHPGV